MTIVDLPERTADLPAPPPARRTGRTVVWRDLRFAGGAALVIACAVIGGAIVNGAERTTPVWTMAHALPAGAVLSADDLIAAPVRLDTAQGAQYFAADREAPIGARLAHAVAADELLSSTAIDADERAERRLVTVSIEASRAPVGLARGDQVDVYVTPRSDAGREGTTARVLERGLIEGVDAGDRRFGGSSDQLSVVLAIPDRVVERVVAGTRRGDVDLVRVEASGA